MLLTYISFLFIAIYECLAYQNQWMPSYYLGSYPERYQTLRMSRGSCIVSLNIFKGKHFNVEMPLINGTTPAGFCAILLNSVENSSLAIALEQGLTDTSNSLFNQNIKMFKVKNENVELIQE